MYQKYVNFWLVTWIINTVGMHSVIFLLKKTTEQLHKIQTYHALAFHFNHCTAHLVVNPTTPPTNSNVLLRVRSQSYSTYTRGQPIYSLEHKQHKGQNVGDWSEKIRLQESSLSKNMSLYSYLSTSFLFHLMPLVA